MRLAASRRVRSALPLPSSIGLSNFRDQDTDASKNTIKPSQYRRLERPLAMSLLQGARVAEPDKFGRTMVWPLRVDKDLTIRCFLPGSIM